jgi:hypothetical protein
MSSLLHCHCTTLFYSKLCQKLLEATRLDRNSTAASHPMPESTYPAAVAIVCRVRPLLSPTTQIIDVMRTASFGSDERKHAVHGISLFHNYGLFELAGFCFNAIVSAFICFWALRGAADEYVGVCLMVVRAAAVVYFYTYSTLLHHTRILALRTYASQILYNGLLATLLKANYFIRLNITVYKVCESQTIR